MTLPIQMKQFVHFVRFLIYLTNRQVSYWDSAWSLSISSWSNLTSQTEWRRKRGKELLSYSIRKSITEDNWIHEIELIKEFSSLWPSNRITLSFIQYVFDQWNSFVINFVYAWWENKKLVKLIFYSNFSSRFNFFYKSKKLNFLINFELFL